MSVNWSLEDLQKAIDEITSGEKLISVENNSDEIMHIIFKYPDRQSIRLSDIEYQRQFSVARKKYKLLTEQEMFDIIEQKKIWTEEDDEKVEEIKERITHWRNKLKNPDLTERMTASVHEMIPKLEEDIFKLEYKKEVMLANTAERKARQAKYEYLVWSCSYNPETNQRYWINYLTYCRIMDAKLKNSLLGEFLRYLGGRKTEEIRYIARSNLWRISYVIAQKTNTPLFPGAVINLTPDQTNLAWWSGYYDSIWQMMPDDQPDDMTIEDDEALDTYMENLHKERSKERATNRAAAKYGSKSAMHMKEVLVMRDNPDYMDLDYTKAPATAGGNVTDSNLNDEAPAGSRAAKQRTKPIIGSKRYTKAD